MTLKTHLPKSLIIILIINILILFTCSFVRHWMFQSSAYDLGIFDQALFLLSQGQPPISSFMNFHILGDHAALICYPIALLYKIYPSVLWLFIIQSVSLSLGGVAIFKLSRLYLTERQSIIITVSYLLYPVIFNANLFDFHPDKIAISALAFMLYFARIKKTLGFVISMIIVLICKEYFSLVIMTTGIMLIFIEKRKYYGLSAIIAGSSYFLIAVKVIIPHYSMGLEGVSRQLGRYSYLGTSWTEAIHNLTTNPFILIKVLFTLNNLFYLVLLLIPLLIIFWKFNWKNLQYLIGVTPIFALNLLCDYDAQKNLTNQYSLPIVPFLFLIVINHCRENKLSRKFYTTFLVWSIIAFLILGKFGYFWSSYLTHLSVRSSLEIAIHKVNPQSAVLTNDYISTHLTHRKIIKLPGTFFKPQELNQFNDILINTADSGYPSSPEIVNNIVEVTQQSPNFVLTYQEKSLYLFTRKN